MTKDEEEDDIEEDKGARLIGWTEFCKDKSWAQSEAQLGRPEWI